VNSPLVYRPAGNPNNRQADRIAEPLAVVVKCDATPRLRLSRECHVAARHNAMAAPRGSSRLKDQASRKGRSRGGRASTISPIVASLGMTAHAVDRTRSGPLPEQGPELARACTRA